MSILYITYINITVPQYIYSIALALAHNLFTSIIYTTVVHITVYYILYIYDMR